MHNFLNPEAATDGGVREGGQRGRPQTTRWLAQTADMQNFALYSIIYEARVQKHIQMICLARRNLADKANFVSV